MIETAHGRDPVLGVPVYSLYSETRKPTPAMLEGLECLVIDLQDVGTRIYTFAWTMMACLESCAAARIPVVVLDRPNPLGGDSVEGPLLDLHYASFVGRSAIPMRHGLTMGELAQWLNAQHKIGADVRVVKMSGWFRRMLWSQTGRTWVLTSPNLPRWEGCLVYPGQVLLEGTNVSEGRGTTTPFEVVGTPFVSPMRLLAATSEAFNLTGLHLTGAFPPDISQVAGQELRRPVPSCRRPLTFRPLRTSLRPHYHYPPSVAERIQLAKAAIRIRIRETADRYPFRQLPVPRGIERIVKRKANSTICLFLNQAAWRKQVAEHILYDG